ncbi:MAG: AAA family ATPase [Thermodesulfovibrio sp.]|nr:AAA family ATPase [Thermodesulfovibrio sp.]MDW7999242.1 AAA family ATPase [Thermodesulfovibrio sp.]
MKIKKFQGRSFKEVLEIVKKEMGPDAVILSTSSKKEPLSKDSFIEITAAIDDNEEMTAQETLNKRASIEESMKVDYGLFKEIEKLKAEVSLLRESVTKLFPSLDDISKRGLYSFLIKNNVEPHLALILLERANNMNDLRKAIDDELKTTKSSFEQEKGYIFYGPPGVGKTTTIYKMGQILRNNNKKIMVISLDQRISSVAYIKELSLKLKCEAKFIDEPKELYKVMHREIDRKNILVDTPGDVNMSLAGELKNLLKDLPIKKCLIMDASMSMQSGLKILKNMDTASVDCIGFSKIDLAQTFGNLYNLSVLSGKPISFVTSGSYGELQFKLLPPNTITNLILGGACEN